MIWKMTTSTKLQLLGFVFFFLALLNSPFAEREKKRKKNVSRNLNGSFPSLGSISPDKEHSWKESALFFYQKHVKKSRGSSRPGCLF